MSVEGRHKSFVKSLSETVGNNIYNCQGNGWCHQHRGDGSLFQGDEKLGNGNYEAKYFLSPNRKCKYFFEYEPESGLIVGFRYEESEKFACRFTGA
jgi:hypothetical protein